METFTCSRCLQEKPVQSKGGTGYGLSNGQKVCYSCCAQLDIETMKREGKIILYLTNDYKLTNWPNTLVFNTISVSQSKHNWGLVRTDVWFEFDGYIWHGYNIGNDSQLTYCKKTTRKV